jgi:chromosomal replication initiator protein
MIESNHILVAVSNRFGVTPDLLRGPRRACEIVRPRQIAYLMVPELRPDLSLPAIGRQFGDRDHTTIMHGIKRARELMRDDPLLCLWVNEAERELRNA